MYAELKCQSNFSFLEGASHPEELVEQAHRIGLTALALTDRNGVYGIPKAYWKVKDFPALKLIVGAELTLSPHPPITLLAQDRAAYGLLCRMLTASHADKKKGKATLTLEELKDFSNHPGFSGLICLPMAGAQYSFLKELWGQNLYLPLSRFKDGHDEQRIRQATEAAHQFELPLVVTNQVLYHIKERRPLQDALSCVRQGKSLLNAGYGLLPNGERYLKSPFEMKLLFKDFPEALQNTLVLAERCTFSPRELRYRYPSEWIPAHHTAQSYLEELTWKGAQSRYPTIPEAVKSQLNHELALIAQLNFADYFLTLFDIVDFARKKQILCQGRGSAANSAVCYCLGITAIDPVRMNLLFERFISVERNEPPDIDVDFEHERREEVIQYIYQKYGRHRAAMVSAVITYQRRSIFRELSKVFGVEVGTLSAKKVEKNFEQLASASPIADCAQQISALSEQMQGFPRHLSIHSGGFTLSADPLIEIVPIEPARMAGRTIIQWDKYDLDYLGLLKVDILALGMLSALRKTLDSVGMQLYEVPPEDPATYEMIQRADTVGTFQIESRAQMNMSGRLMPRNFYDLVIQVAIVRPGPIVGKMVHPYLKRRRGLEPIFYPHPKLKEILGKTLGVPLFQEQVMKIAIELGGFSPGEADQLRRAIGAWRAQGSIQKVGEKLAKGLKKQGISDDYAHLIFEQLKGFAHYGFPESHAASFALLSYASCYLKCHFPTQWACALINSQPMGFYSVHTIIDDAKRHGVKVFPVSPNHSDYNSSLEDGGLRLGLRTIRGLAKSEAEQIVRSRPYSDLADFLMRTELRQEILHRLAMGDFFRGFGQEQRATLWQLLADYTFRHKRQLDLFDGKRLSEGGVEFKGLDNFEVVCHDYAAFGLSVRQHPLAALRAIKRLPKWTTRSVRQTAAQSRITVGGLLLVRQRPPTASGVCFAAIEDEYGILDLVLFKAEFEKFKEIFLYNCFLAVTGYIERDHHSVSMIVKRVAPLFDSDPESEQLNIEPTQYFW